MGGTSPGFSALVYARPAAAGNYFVVITTLAGVAAISFFNDAATPEISTTSLPLALPIPMGSNANFTVVASGTQPLNYQWLFNGGIIAGATASTYTRSNVQPADAGNYSVAITNLPGAAASSNAPLAVVQPPAITAQPLMQSIPMGSNANFTVVATGTQPLNYQWLFNGGIIAGATA